MSEFVTTGDLLKHLRNVAKERDEIRADLVELLANCGYPVSIEEHAVQERLRKKYEAGK